MQSILWMRRILEAAVFSPAVLALPLLCVEDQEVHPGAWYPNRCYLPSSWKNMYLRLCSLQSVCFYWMSWKVSSFGMVAVSRYCYWSITTAMCHSYGEWRGYYHLLVWKRTRKTCKAICSVWKTVYMAVLTLGFMWNTCNMTSATLHAL